MRCHLKPAEVERIIAIAGGCLVFCVTHAALDLPDSRRQVCVACACGLLVALLQDPALLRELLLLRFRAHCSYPPAPAEPYTLSVRKRASRMSMAAGDFVLRSVGGKSHAR